MAHKWTTREIKVICNPKRRFTDGELAEKYEVSINAIRKTRTYYQDR